MDEKELNQMEDKATAFVDQTLLVLGHSTDGFEQRLSLMSSLLGSWLNKEFNDADKTNLMTKMGLCSAGISIATGRVYEAQGDILEVTKGHIKKRPTV